MAARVQLSRTRGVVLRGDGLDEPVEFFFRVGVEKTRLSPRLAKGHGGRVGVFLSVEHEIDVEHNFDDLGGYGKGAILAYCALTKVHPALICGVAYVQSRAILRTSPKRVGVRRGTVCPLFQP